MRLLRICSLALAAALVSAACADVADDGAAEASSTSAPTRPEPTSGPIGDGAVQTAEPSGPWDLVLTDVEVSSRGAGDRLVLTFAGSGRPGWSVGPVDRPAQDGSGDLVRLDGDSYLDVYASGTVLPAADDARAYRVPARIAPSRGRVAEVNLVGTFEGYTQVLVGLTGEAPDVDVTALARPPRLVVDLGG
ncbi:hypothetical protein [Nocardioides sp. R-C-SC26]|uniref:AMIN-like domain-containing (lipo)protein n=1 Tax=Nocardioides sp. R-C-SC26 TaxID=2870414 RepID=UPI001E3F7CC5|nr:hypothetical protein [Nocardioides sp. R-C-SC26]